VKRLFFILLVFTSGCSYFKNQSAPEPQASVFSLTFDPALIVSTDLHSHGLVKEFYKRNRNTFVWSDTAGLSLAADSMISIIRSAERYGLLADDYHLGEIDKLLILPKTHARALALDLYLSDGFFTLWHHLKNGRLDGKTLSRVSLSSSADEKAIEALNNSLPRRSFRTALEFREPDDSKYRLLKITLRDLLTVKNPDTIILSKIRSVVANLERTKWADGKLSDRYITVNVPSFELKVVDQDSVILKSKVIVGKPETQTPEMQSVVRSFIIYPYWHVPRSILKEILPQIQEDSLYFRRHNYEALDRDGNVVKVSTINWMAYDADTFPYVLRQREGSENTMGVIKFIFNNNYGVYLHDTNARRLFSKDDRALSHGCIRVQKAVELARYLAKDDDTYVSPEDLDQYLMVQHRLEVKVVKPIPLFLQYITCEEKDGKIIFYKDIYEKDKMIIDALTSQEQAPAL
jgi:murein L,D-transpeptidase YcbB/YkuD